MSIVIPNSYALALAAAGNADLPVIGFDNLVTVAGLLADSADADFPVSNLGNPATNLRWQSGTTDDQVVRALFGEAPVDYLGLARHNLGSGGTAVTVQGLAFGGDPDDDGDWTDLAGPQVPADDTPLLFRFEETNLVGIRLKLEPDATPPSAAVLYAGKLLVMERGVQAGQPALPFARQRSVINAYSQAGEMLGSVVSGGKLKASASFIKLSPAWTRSTLQPFLRAAFGQPFFWAWWPSRYPAEVAFATFASEPLPAPSDLAGWEDVTFDLEALLL